MGILVPTEQPTVSAALEITDVSLRFGGIRTLDQVSLAVAEGQVCAIIGPNGAGKTSLFNVISGLYRPQEGSVRYRGTETLGLRPDRLAALGIARTFQNVALFSGLSVLDNVLVGSHLTAPRDGFLASALQLPGTRRRERQMVSTAMDLLRSLNIDSFAHHQVDDLAFGTRKRVEIARALAAEPSMLMLDEPAAGLPHGEVDDLVDLLRTVRDTYDLTLLVVEHHMRLVMSLADHVVALNFGKVMAQGEPRSVAADPVVIEAYLGAKA